MALVECASSGSAFRLPWIEFTTEQTQESRKLFSFHGGNRDFVWGYGDMLTVFVVRADFCVLRGFCVLRSLQQYNNKKSIKIHRTYRNCIPQVVAFGELHASGFNEIITMQRISAMQQHTQTVSDPTNSQHTHNK